MNVYKTGECDQAVSKPKGRGKPTISWGGGLTCWNPWLPPGVAPEPSYKETSFVLGKKNFYVDPLIIFSSQNSIHSFRLMMMGADSQDL
jgi:hypothetical protein